MSLIRTLRDAAVFAPCYVALDWASYFDPVGPFNITPWNPQAALAVVWMLLGGLGHAPVVLAVIFAADVLVRGAPGGWLITGLGSVCLAGGYALMAKLLRDLLTEVGLRSSRSLTVLVTVGTLLGCSGPDPASSPLEARSSTPTTKGDEPTDVSTDPLVDLLVSLLPIPCPTSNAAVPTTTTPATPAHLDPLDALGFGTLPPPACVPVESTP